jgi:hypothetical protein
MGRGVPRGSEELNCYFRNDGFSSLGVDWIKSQDLFSSCSHTKKAFGVAFQCMYGIVRES